MKSQITYTEKATKQQIKLNFIKKEFSLDIKWNNLKICLLYKQSTNVLYMYASNNSLAQRSENHWKYFFLLDIIWWKNWWTWHKSIILDQLNIEFQKIRTYNPVYGADPVFQVRGGALKKITPSGGRRENFGGISCEKSRFHAKKSYFFQLPREARKFLRYFVWKIIFFPILGEARVGCAPPPESAPAHNIQYTIWYALLLHNFAKILTWRHETINVAIKQNATMEYH